MKQMLRNRLEFLVKCIKGNSRVPVDCNGHDVEQRCDTANETDGSNSNAQRSFVMKKFIAIYDS